MAMSSDENSFYYKFSMTCDQVDILTALLNELPFNGFETVGNKQVNAYLESDKVDDQFMDQLEGLKRILPFNYQKEKIANQNWNAAWEADFDPVIVDDFCVVRADFHPPFTDKQYEIIITPQMSFGTGHHETTRGMIQLMRDIDFCDKKVLDFGCGTCVLAILAAKMGANDILGVDIDNNAYTNSLDNCALNQELTIHVKQGGLSVTEPHYDVILANINRHVILDSLPSLSSKLSSGSPLLISGILHSDIPLLEKHLKEASFKVVNTLQLNEWMCILTHKV